MNDGKPSRVRTDQDAIDEIDRQIEDIILHMPSDLEFVHTETLEIPQGKETA